MVADLIWLQDVVGVGVYDNGIAIRICRNLDFIGAGIVYDRNVDRIKINLTGGVSTRANKDMSPLATVGDNAPTGLLVAETPVGGTAIQVFVGPLAADVGDGDVLKDCYFGNLPGIAKAFPDVVVGDQLYWNGVLARYDLAPTDRVDFVYDV